MIRSVTLFVLFFSSSVYADIYVFVDKNGVRHISNNPSDPRYKRVMETPRYKTSTATVPSNGTPAAGQTGAAENSINANGKRWKLITPSSEKKSIAALTKRSSIRWGKKKTGKPFTIDEKNRRRFSNTIARAAAKHRLDPHLIHAVISAESAFNPRAVSPAGAMGLMQLMPATARRFGVTDAFDPNANIYGGVRYLRWLLNHFKNNVRLALAGYNAGENAVKKYGNTIPPYPETQTYVKRVLRFYHHYRQDRS